MGAWILVALKAIAAIPAIFDRIEKFAVWLDAFFKAHRKAEADKKMAEEIGKVENAPGPEKDTCQLEQMFDPSKQCPPNP